MHDNDWKEQREAWSACHPLRAPLSALSCAGALVQGTWLFWFY